MKRFLVSLLFLATSAEAAYFQNINNYTSRNCSQWKLSRFKNVKNWITFGVEDARSYGYDFEVPISRRGVDAIWCALVPNRGNKNKSCAGVVDFDNPQRPFNQYAAKKPLTTVKSERFNSLEEQYTKYLKYVKAAVKKEKIKRPNVGLVLEILSRYYLQKLTNYYPENVYAITGGVAYFQAQGQRTIGELDIIIYRKDTCEVEVIGESKASSPGNQRNALKKAKSQLKRFRDFLKREL